MIETTCQANLSSSLNFKEVLAGIASALRVRPFRDGNDPEISQREWICSLKEPFGDIAQETLLRYVKAEKEGLQIESPARFAYILARRSWRDWWRDYHHDGEISLEGHIQFSEDGETIGSLAETISDGVNYELKSDIRVALGQAPPDVCKIIRKKIAGVTVRRGKVKGCKLTGKEKLRLLEWGSEWLPESCPAPAKN